jgi:hypothetical protein
VRAFFFPLPFPALGLDEKGAGRSCRKCLAAPARTYVWTSARFFFSFLFPLWDWPIVPEWPEMTVPFSGRGKARR